MASAAIARAAAVGPTVAAPQAHANSSLLSAKALALVTKRVLARRAPACADKTRDGGDGDGGGNDWDNAAGERAPGARGNEVKGQGVQLAASAQQHQCLHDSNRKSCRSGVCVQGSATYSPGAARPHRAWRMHSRKMAPSRCYDVTESGQADQGRSSAQSSGSGALGGDETTGPTGGCV